MIAASSSFLPSSVNTAPRPALNTGLSSSAMTALVTASKLEPPLARIAMPPASAELRPWRYSRSSSAVISARGSVPAPP